MKHQYVKTDRSALPESLRFDTPAHNSGQIVEVSYADYPTGADEACYGSAYKRVHDRSDNTTEYFRLVKP